MKQNKKMKIALFAALAVIVLFIGGAFTYRWYFTMGVIESYAINSEVQKLKILVLTQQSSFKDKVMEEIKTLYMGKDIFIDVRDVTEVNRIDIDDYDGIYVLTTIQSSDVPKQVYQLIDNTDVPYQVGATAQSGKWAHNYKNIDAITQPSAKANVSLYANDIKTFIEEVSENSKQVSTN